MAACANYGGKRESLAPALFWSGASFFLSHLPSQDSLLVLNYHRVGIPEDDSFGPGVFSAAADQFNERGGLPSPARFAGDSRGGSEFYWGAASWAPYPCATNLIRGARRQDGVGQDLQPVEKADFEVLAFRGSQVTLEACPGMAGRLSLSLRALTVILLARFMGTQIGFIRKRVDFA